MFFAHPIGLLVELLLLSDILHFMPELLTLHITTAEQLIDDEERAMRPVITTHSAVTSNLLIKWPLALIETLLQEKNISSSQA